MNDDREKRFEIFVNKTGIFFNRNETWMVFLLKLICRFAWLLCKLFIYFMRHNNLFLRLLSKKWVIFSSNQKL